MKVLLIAGEELKGHICVCPAYKLKSLVFIDIDKIRSGVVYS